MKYLMIIALAFCACDDENVDTAEVTRMKADCTRILTHVVSVSPQGQGINAAAFAATLPVEDIGGCVASEPEIRDCLEKAADLAGIKTCIPSVAKLECMQLATKKHHADIRAKCWAGDEHAADSLKKEEN